MSNIIEFYGPPGSGKTILARKAVKYLRSKKIKTIGRNESQRIGLNRWCKQTRKASTELRTLSFILDNGPKLITDNLTEKSHLFIDRYEFKKELINDFIFENRDFFELILDCTEDLYHDNAEKIILSRFTDSISIYQNIFEYIEDEFIVLDEAFCNDILIAFSLLNLDIIPSNYKNFIMKLVNHISNMIDYGFFVEIKPEISLKRQKSRERIVRGIKDERDNQKLLKDLKLRYENSKLIHRTLSENNIPSFKIDNNKSLELSEKQLYDHLDHIISDNI